MTRQLIYSMFVSLDGYINDAEGRIDWHLPDEELHVFVNAREAEADTYIYGRRLYETMTYWEDPKLLADPLLHIAEYAQIFQATPKLVVSRSLEAVVGNARLIGDNVAEEIAKLKAGPGKTITVGGATLARSLVPTGLIDEYRLFVHPVMLGGGTLYFPADGRRLGLRLLDLHRFASGVTFRRYAPS